MSTTTTQTKRTDKRRYARESDRRGRRPGGRTSPRRGTDRSMERLFEDSLGATTGRDRERRLEEVVLTTWAALASGHPVECPVCGGVLQAESGCKSCGSKLG